MFQAVHMLCMMGCTNGAAEQGWAPDEKRVNRRACLDPCLLPLRAFAGLSVGADSFCPVLNGTL